MAIWCADFETTTDVNDCRVWAWACCEVDNIDNIHYGTDLSTFMLFMRDNNGTYYFHNLAFDGEFVISWLFLNGWTHSKLRESNTFDTLISSTGKFYSIELTFKKKKGKHKSCRCDLRDSLKKLPFSIKNVAKAFHLKESKGTIDYTLFRPIGHELTTEEKEYITTDIRIPAQALAIQFAQGLKKMTVGADALATYKDTVSNRWDALFPELNLLIDADIRHAYKGGYTYLKPEHANRTLDNGIVLDVNSLYPHVMYSKPLPVGIPLFFRGKYEPDDKYPLYIQHLTCMVKLKDGKLPTLQVKNNPFYVSTQYITETDEPLDLFLSSVDLELMFDHYDVEVMCYADGWKFHSEEGCFREYIDYWTEIKQTTTGGERTLAKLMLNSLYGKFATNPDVTGKIPTLDDEGVVRYKMGEQEYRKPVYTPVGVFVTSWARDMTIRAAQSVYHRFIYADTDSLHLLGDELPENMTIHPTNLGAWAHEATFTRSKFLRAKTYMEEIDGKIDVKCAGLPENLRDGITFGNFQSGLKIFGKLRPNHVRGGIVLEPTTFTVL